ncbi:MAG: DUF4886 domain-containing protein [Kiritimatiellia bacterium]|jgi:hypothetical protein
MKKRMQGAWIVAAAMAVAGLTQAQTPTPEATAKPSSDELKVLAIGNSFSNNATRQLPALAKAAGKKLKVVGASIGGCDFEKHVRLAEAHAADPAQGKPYGGKSLQQMLASDAWDVVTIQQVSHKSFKPETFRPHALKLIAIIREYAPQAEIVIHQTWAYRDDHKFWGKKDFDTDVMYAGVRKTYDDFAAEVGFRLIPSGDAMEAARRDAEWGPFLAGDPPAPRGEKALHVKDAYHANVKGEYLQGCVWLAFLFKEKVSGNPFVPKGMTADEAAVLQRIADEVVIGGKRPGPRVGFSGSGSKNQ